MEKKKLSILIFTIKYSDNSEDYSANYVNCDFTDQRFYEVPEGTTVGQLCNMFKDANHPEVFMLTPFISFTARGILKTAKVTEFYNDMVKPVDKSKVLDGSEVFHMVKSNKDGSNIDNFLYLR